MGEMTPSRAPIIDYFVTLVALSHILMMVRTRLPSTLICRALFPNLGADRTAIRTVLGLIEVCEVVIAIPIPAGNRWTVLIVPLANMIPRLPRKVLLQIGAFPKVLGFPLPQKWVAVPFTKVVACKILNFLAVFEVTQTCALPLPVALYILWQNVLLVSVLTERAMTEALPPNVGMVNL